MSDQQTPRSPVADADMKFDIRIGKDAVPKSPADALTFVATFAAGIAVGALTTRRSSRR